ncbi:polycomb complex protein BMI-1-like [Pollicipes pollicipes]|uniref:polycomb complex protein BMI-1-like n=1 Tax=Pollicipes pollicipes TaxID=41117 RepID=UPI00188498E3|nr:polycomb complex protein BMI-1-like [Pollicipes pollicipes]
MEAIPDCRPQRAVGVADLTPHLVCTLCGGYYIDATTIVECLHTFCRSCILRHLEASIYCPALTCDVMIHRTKGAVSLRPDTTLQSIVYKTVPGLYRDEMGRRQQFYRDKPGADPDLTPIMKGAQEEASSRFYAPDDTIDVRIQYASHSVEEVVPVRYLRCPAGLPLAVLKKFLYQKYRFTDNLQMELIHGRKVLPLDVTLLDVAYIVNWSRKSALKLLFRVSKTKVSKRKVVALDPAGEPPPKVWKLSANASGPGECSTSHPRSEIAKPCQGEERSQPKSPPASFNQTDTGTPPLPSTGPRHQAASQPAMVRPSERPSGQPQSQMAKPNEKFSSQAQGRTVKSVETPNNQSVVKPTERVNSHRAVVKPCGSNNSQPTDVARRLLLHTESAASRGRQPSHRAPDLTPGLSCRLKMRVRNS